MYIEIEDMDTSMYITSFDIIIVNRNSKLLIQKILNILKNENENYIYYFFRKSYIF
uniref:Uncharacterized protein n=1 Tax=viral metagenome TaxID=1070528 RepID=A0A6C0AEH4_9ZZZZ